MVFLKSLLATFLILGSVLCSASVLTSSAWTHLGPPPGIVSDVAIDPLHPSTLYAGTLHGVFKSVDGGSHWFPSSAGQLYIVASNDGGQIRRGTHERVIIYKRCLAEGARHLCATGG